jgi:hypothetical protein
VSGGRQPLTVASALVALIAAGAILAGHPAIAWALLASAGAVHLARRAWRRWTGPARTLRLLAHARGVHDTKGLLVQARRDLLPGPFGEPHPRLRVHPRADGLLDLALKEPRRADVDWSDLNAAFEHATGREWALRRQPGSRWVTFHPALPLPDHADRPADTLRADDPLLIPLGSYRDDDGGLSEVLVDLNQGHLAIGGAPGTGKTTLGMHVAAHLLATGAGEVWLLDPKRVTWPHALAEHPRVRALVTDPDAIYGTLAELQTVMMARYQTAHATDVDPASLAAAEGHHIYMLEEVAELLDIFRQRSKPRGQAAAGFVGATDVIGVLSSLARLGSQAGVHLVAVAQDWNARQFGGTSLRGLFAARTSGWQERVLAAMLDLPDASNLPIRDGRPLAGRMVLAREGRLPVRYQAYHLHRDQLTDTSRGRPGRLAPPHRPMPSAARPASSLSGGGASSGQGTTALAGPDAPAKPHQKPAENTAGNGAGTAPEGDS